MSRIFFYFLFFLFIHASAQGQAGINLSGKWAVALDPNDEGILKKWYNGDFNDSMSLPGTTDIAHLGLPEQSPWINYLTRPYKFIGPVWYKRNIFLPQDWKNDSLELYLERVLWESRVWIDGKAVAGADDGLTVPHTHILPPLTAGLHSIAIRVDNRMIHPIGDKGHNYTELTQSIWNGIVGNIRLSPKNSLKLYDIRIIPDASRKKVEVIAIAPKNTNSSKILFTIKNAYGNIVGTKAYLIDSTQQEISCAIPVNEAKEWSEFTQPLYTVEIQTIGDHGQTIQSRPIQFGFRKIGVEDLRITINGHKTVMRGSQDCLAYPLTGHPPMKKEEWLKIFKIYKDYGFNQVRFHSACPPEAAFEAADELGLYLQVEVVWITSRNSMPDIRPTSITLGQPKGLGTGDRTTDSFVEKEAHRIIAEYGNHPSFCFFSFGNEMDNLNKNVVNQWTGDLKKFDLGRRLFATTTARAVLSNDDFQDSHVISQTKGFIVNETGRSNTLWDYDSLFRKSKLPVIAHELGQVPSYPEWKEITHYTGPLRPYNLSRFHQIALQNHVAQYDSLYRKASGYLQSILYKEDIESELRSMHSAGYNMLSMNDYPGQGEALIGWFNALWENKNTISAKAFRSFNNSVVPLARFSKYIYSGQDSFHASIDIAYNNAWDENQQFEWELTNDANGKIFAKGFFKNHHFQPGSLENIGTVHSPLSDQPDNYSFTLIVHDTRNTYQNQWHFWHFAIPQTSKATEGILITSQLDSALQALNTGKKVLLITTPLLDKKLKNYASFMPVFWSTAFFPDQGSQTLGALIDNHHKALSQFPTGPYMDRQWQKLADNAKAIVMDGEAADLQLIVEPINDFHSNKRLSTLFEVKAGNGKLMVCGYDLSKDELTSNVLKNSLLQYMSSADFDPRQTVSKKWLLNKFSRSNAESERQSDTLIDYVLKQEVVSQSTVQNNIHLQYEQKNDSKAEITFKNTGIFVGELQLQFNHTSPQPSTTTITIMGRKMPYKLSAAGQVISIPVFREDFENNALTVLIQSSDTKVFLQRILLQKN